MRRLCVICAVLSLLSGCAFLPELSRQPLVQNPFPQLSRVAVAPFFNLSAEATVDGREFAIAYFNELQNVPGFEVVPVGVVEQAMRAHQMTLADPVEARRLAQLLHVDAVVVGAITEYTPYYPPRIGLQVEWYAANPCFHAVPPGYGLPWGTPLEEEIPDELVYEAEFALAREQMNTQTPLYEPPRGAGGEPKPLPVDGTQGEPPADASTIPSESSTIRHLSATAPLPPADVGDAQCQDAEAQGLVGAATGLPHDWPDPRGFAPAPPQAIRPPCIESHEPVLKHTNIYLGNDSRVTAALQTFVYYQDDARFGGWQNYLQRSGDFTRFCCYLHISEMLTARGGGGETRVVWRWPSDR